MRVGRGAAKWAAAVLVVSLVLPAVTKQWSDNQQQHQLKTDVTTKLASALAQATTDGGFLLADQLETGQSQADTRAAYKDALVTWKSEASGIDAQLAGYFAESHEPSEDSLVKAMRAYTRVVEDYIAYCWSYTNAGQRADYLKDFKTNMDKIRNQVSGTPRADVVPKLVSAYVSPDPPITADVFKEKAQNLWAQHIVNASAPIIATINQRQPRGFQVGARAFIRQILQPVS